MTDLPSQPLVCDYRVTLPISGVQADMAGMPALVLERAIKRIGDPICAPIQTTEGEKT